LTSSWKLGAVVALALAGTQLAAASTVATNGGVFSFTSLRGGNAALFVAKGNGTAARRLTLAGGGAYQGDAAWSPDGSRLVFTCGNFELCVASANGTAAARLTTSTWPAKWSYDFEPAWSPDGTRIVFTAKRGGISTGLWIVNADGTGLKKLIDSAADEGSAEWSPDGLRIAYGRITATNTDVFVINAAGRGAQRLTTGKAYESNPDWSPDGTTIAYERARDASLASEVWLMNASGGEQRRLTAGEAPSWAPDGSLLLFSAPEGRDDEIFSVRADGSGRTRLTKSRGGDYTPNLRPAGVTVTLPAAPSTPLAAVHRNARVVGTFLARYPQIYRDLSGLNIRKVGALAPDAHRLLVDADAGRKAMSATRPVSALGRRLRTQGIAGFTAASKAAHSLLEIVRLAPEGPTAATRIVALQKTYQAQLDTMDRRFVQAFAAVGL
jgi:Tol biopolymer transport system component